MLKWILGIIAAVILLVLGTCWYGYRKFTAGGDTARVAIAAPPERVWRYLTIPDSMLTWQDSTVSMRVSSDSAITLGDTVMIESTTTRTGNQPRRRMLWIVTSMAAPTTITWAARDDSTGTEILRRIDSVTTAADSTVVISHFAAPLTDSLRQGDSTGALAGRFLSGAGKLATSAMRAMAETELARLKVVLERP